MDANDLDEKGIISYPAGELNPNIIFLGLILFGAGAILTFASIYIGALLFIPAIGAFLHKINLEVDFENKRMREATKLWKMTWGEWEELPELEYLSVFKAKVSRTYNGRFTSSKDNYEVIQVNVITAENKKIKLFQSQDVDKAYNVAKQYALMLGIDVWDATTKEGRWL